MTAPAIENTELALQIVERLIGVSRPPGLTAQEALDSLDDWIDGKPMPDTADHVFNPLAHEQTR